MCEVAARGKEGFVELRQMRVEDIDAVCGIIEQARVRLAGLGIDQWQGSYPDRAAIEGDVAAGRGYVVVGERERTASGEVARGVNDGGSARGGCGKSAAAGGESLDRATRAACDAPLGSVSDVSDASSYVAQAVLASAMFDSSGEPTYDVIYEGAWLTECTSAEPAYLTVHRVAVTDGATGKGVASYLLGRAEDYARKLGCASVRIDTHAGNVPMQKLLAKCGYVHCGTILLADPAEPTRERLAFEKLV